MTIYTSPFPPAPLFNGSIISFVLPEEDRYSPKLPAFIDANTGKVVTRGELRSALLELGYGMRNVLPKLGALPLTRGDTVMIFSPNSIAWPILIHGSMTAGVRATLANSAYTPQELAHQWKDSKAQSVFVHPTLVPVVLEMFKLLGMTEKDAKQRIIIAGFGEADKGPAGFVQMEQLLGKGKLPSEEKFNGEQVHETAILCYSSGTTGKPKGVETTHLNLTSVTDIIHLSFPATTETDCFIGVLPFYHIYGVVNLLTFSLRIGIPVVIMPRFDPVAFCKNIETYKVSIALIVPPILVVLARHPAAQQFNLKSLRYVFSGAAPLGAPLIDAVQKRFSSFGMHTTVITQGYGLTETSPACILLPVSHGSRKKGSIGLLLANLEGRLVRDDKFDVPQGEPGEIWIRGPSVMKGYLNNPEATAKSITKDGWFKTGDIAVRDEEGFYFVVDRQKELIKYKGFQVPPAELESLLLQHPEIADAGVIGVESVSEATELPRAYVVHAKGLTSDAEKQKFASQVAKWVESRVAKHKFLRGGVVVIDAIPKSASGKILRRELRDLAKTELAAQGPAKAKL